MVDFVAGQRDPPGDRGFMGSFGGGEHGEEGVGEHRQDCPAVPGGPASDLVLIEPGEAFAGLKRFFDGPSPSRDLAADAARTVHTQVRRCVAGQVRGVRRYPLTSNPT